MNTIGDRADIGRLLMQMRDMQSQMRDTGPQGIQQDGAVKATDSLPSLTETQDSEFGKMLKSAVDAVNDSQMKAAEMQTAYQTGDETVDLTAVMIQMQKASVSFEAMTQVRNRLVTAYQDIMNMPI